MKRFSTTATALPPTTLGSVGKAWEEVSASFDHFCLAAGIEALGTMLENDAHEAWGPRRYRGGGRGGVVPAGAARRGRSASMAAGWKLSGREYASLVAGKWYCRAGSGRSQRIGWVGGR